MMTSTRSSSVTFAIVLVAISLTMWGAAVSGTGPEQAAAQQPAGRGGGRGGPVVPELPFSDRTGFESMFDGKSLTPGEQAAEVARKAAAEKAKTEGDTGRGRGRGFGGPQISRFQDWDGDPKFWRVENGTIVGESTPDKVVKPNTFLIWRGGAPGDF
jgi:hypothetical protein